jgi:hypothetical protein
MAKVLVKRAEETIGSKEKGLLHEQISVIVGYQASDFSNGSAHQPTKLQQPYKTETAESASHRDS